MSQVFRGHMARGINVAALIVAAPFILVGVGITAAILSATDLIHKCRFGERKYDYSVGKYYVTCHACGHKIEVDLD